MTYTQVICYLRVSTGEQLKGMGLEGQRNDCAAMAQHLGVSIDKEVIDSVSGWHAKHRAAGGGMHGFEQDVRAGLYQGAILIVSKLDRLTREGSEEGGDLLRTLSRGGVTVGSAEDREVYEAGVKKRMDQAFRQIMKFELAHDESEKKADRGRMNYDIKHKHCRANKLAVTKNVAPWIVVRPDRTMVLDDERAELVRTIFAWADNENIGGDRIAKRLNQNRVPLWAGREKKPATEWTRTRIDKVLRDRAAIGEFQPSRDGKPNGSVWLDHFPAAVDHALFERVRCAGIMRKKVSTTNRDTKIRNIFAGLVKCGECGGNMIYQQGRTAGSIITTRNGSQYTYSRDNGSLVCATASRYGACSNRGYLAYLTFEDTILKASLHLALDDTAFARKDEVGRLNVLIAERERALSVATDTATNLALAWGAKPSEMRRKMADDAEDAADALAKNLKALTDQREDARGKVSSQEHLARVEDVRANLYHDDLTVRVPLRRKVQCAVRNVIHSMVYSDGAVTVVMDGGLVAFIVRRKAIEPITNATDAIRSGVIPLPRNGNREVQAQIEARMRKARA